MTLVNKRVQGQSFGEDALINDKPRNATCFVMTEYVITGTLTKFDFNRVLLERERQHIELKIN